MRCTPTEHLVSADAVVSLEPQPRSEACPSFPSTHAQVHFTSRRLSAHHIDAIDPRQIHSPRDALRFIGEMEVRIIFVLFALLFLEYFFFR
jgi:hypothetical protein